MLYIRICFDKPGLSSVRESVRDEHRAYVRSGVTKGSSGNKCSDWRRVWLHGVVPFAVKGITADVEVVHFSIQGHSVLITGFQERAADRS